jgi:hypothetical protein
MLKSLFALSGIAAVALSAAAIAQQAAPVPRAGVVRSNQDSVNAGTLACSVGGGTGFVFGSTKALSCIFTRSDGVAERYDGQIERFGVDIGFTKQAQVLWLVFAPGVVAPGALAGHYAGVAAQATLGAGLGTNALAGGGSRQINLQPVSVAGAEGLNLAGGLAEISLHAVR